MAALLLDPPYTQVAGLPVFGVAIPTVAGLRLVLERLGAARGARRVLWHNQREEPVVYINGGCAAVGIDIAWLADWLAG